MRSKIFPIASLPCIPVWNVLALVLFMLSEPIKFFKEYLASRVRLEVNTEGILISGGIYGRSIPKESIIPEGIRFVNLNYDEMYKPGMKSSGLHYPFYKEGWYRLKNGERALVFVTDESKTIYIPTKEGYSVLFSLNEPEELLQLLRSEN